MSSSLFNNNNQNAKSGENQQGSSSEEKLMNHHHSEDDTSYHLEITITSSNTGTMVQNVFTSSSSSRILMHQDEPTTTSSAELLPNTVLDPSNTLSSSDDNNMPPPPPRTSFFSGNFPSLLMNHSSSTLVPQQTPSHVFYFQSGNNGALFRFIPLFEMIQELVDGEEWRSVKLSSERPTKTTPNLNNRTSSREENQIMEHVNFVEGMETSSPLKRKRCDDSSETMVASSCEMTSSESSEMTSSEHTLATNHSNNNTSLSLSSPSNTITDSTCVKKTKFSCMNFDDLPIHIRRHILGYIYVPFQECFFSYPILHLNIQRMFGRFKNDPSRKIYLIYSSLGMKLKDQIGQSTPMYRSAKDVKLLIDPKVSNLNFLSGFTSLEKLSLYLTDCNFLTLLEKHSKILPKITFLSLILYKDFSEYHYRETFCQLTNLKTLELFSDLERFSIKGTKFNLPPNLTTLRLLNYEFIDFACICHNAQITSLTVVDSCNLANIDQISNLRNLKRLKINEEQTFDGQNIDLSAIFQLDTLERLSLPLVSFKYRLTGLRSLQTLRIYIEDATLPQIENYANYILECTTLKNLKFEFADDLPHNVQNRFIDIISQHPAIESLQLICENITDDQLVNYFFNKNERNVRFPSLTALDISLCDDLSLMPFRYLLERNDLILDHFKTIKLPAHLVSSGVDECLNVLIPSISFVGGDSALSSSYDFDLADFDDDDDSTTNEDGEDDDDDSELLSEILSTTAAAADFLPDSSDDEILERFVM
ncbi:hypothetical protein C9374_002700 [Naegleria lovaniensis]|uniref:Uncharacterized protein n=1 Tax=Naegleria lovaniensis TaxID=51637 RepID=A0AA88GV15_NAELO|nr:uncharacterized protein C9374_002700 [Naegleria lovaniensis]KAG2386254.1 hypothetical protein C9374_002700 [Naegleria lovaniensis]